jgi:hypothetical protein
MSWSVAPSDHQPLGAPRTYDCPQVSTVYAAAGPQTSMVLRCYIAVHVDMKLYKGFRRNNSHILKGNENQKKQGTQKILLLIKAHIMQVF